MYVMQYAMYSALHVYTWIQVRVVVGVVRVCVCLCNFCVRFLVDVAPIRMHVCVVRLAAVFFL